MSLPRNGFTFKQFFVAHDRCAMKVNTDAIILGAWAAIDGAKRILDVGTGSGVIALMLVQRSPPNTRIDAVELEPQAFCQAKGNFAHSPWPERIQAINRNIVDYAHETGLRYDAIIANPPYFELGVECRSAARSQARYTETLSHAELVNSCGKLLAEGGRVCLVLPYATGLNFMRFYEREGWFFGRTLTVRDSEIKPPHLLLFEMAPYPLIASESFLTIRRTDRSYSEDFRRLTGNFYLFF